MIVFKLIKLILTLTDGSLRVLPSNKSPKSDINIITDEPTKDDALDFNNYRQHIVMTY
ncbi:MAG: hypothetical protein WBE61_07255 [Nitrososphaeraceae archaeon]